MKKLFVILLISVLLLSLAPISVLAEDVPPVPVAENVPSSDVLPAEQYASKAAETAPTEAAYTTADLQATYTGACGSNLTWTLDTGTGSLTISGTGEMNYDLDTAPWYTYRSSIKSVSIDSGVTSVSSRAFNYCTSLTSVSIPDSVTSIGYLTFSDCSITSIDVAENNASYASQNGVLFNKDKSTLICCPSRKSGAYSIPDSVMSIEDYAFANCNNLTSVSIPDGITSIGKDVFSGCSNLTYNEYDNAVYLGNSVHPNVVLVKAKNTSISSCDISDQTKVIYYSSFNNCKNITSITIPDSVTSIGSQAFYYCSSLTGITIPSGITSIGSSAFTGCSSLTSIDVSINYLSYASADGVLFSKDKSTLFCCPGAKSGAYSIPDGVTSIVDGAFCVCKNLTNIYFSSSVTSLGNSVFSRCNNLTSISIPNNVTKIGFQLFRDCSSLTSVTIPEGVTSIGYEAFLGCSSLTNVMIPDSVMSIGSHAFVGCNSLTNVSIGNGVTSISDIGLYNCSGLKTIIIGDGISNIDWSKFSEFNDLESITIGGGLKTVEDNAFSGLTKLKSVTLASGVRRIGANAFKNCESLESVTLPEKLAEIGTDAFSGCYADDVYYGGTQEQWALVTINSGNDMFQRATIHYQGVERLIGDINGDGAVNAKDVTVLRRYLAGGYGITLS